MLRFLRAAGEVRRAGPWLLTGFRNMVCEAALQAVAHKSQHGGVYSEKDDGAQCRVKFTPRTAGGEKKGQAQH